MTEPLRKKFAKSLNGGALGMGLFVLAVLGGGNQFYEIEDHDWDMDSSDRRVEMLKGFNDARHDLVEMKEKTTELESQFDKAALSWDGKTYSIYKEARDKHINNLNGRATQYIKTLLNSKDIHEKDARDLVFQFNAKGLNQYSAIKNLTADKMRSRNEIRTEYGSDYATLDNYGYDSVVGDMRDTVKYPIAMLGGLMGVLAYMVGAIGVSAIVPFEKWEELPNKPKKDKSKKLSIRQRLSKKKRLEN